MVGVCRPHRHDDHAGLFADFSHRGGEIGGRRYDSGRDGVREVREVDVVQRGNEALSLMQIADNYLCPEGRQLVGAVTELTCEHPHSMPLLAKTSDHVFARVAVASGRTHDQDRVHRARRV